MLLVHYGREWPHEVPPCSKNMVSKLERNERLVFWLQPRQGTEKDQIPALKLPDGYYTLSLRMMKAIWRHVRLKKGFSNIERAHLGGYKLRIPTMLLTEKMRTQSRFNVSKNIAAFNASCQIYISRILTGLPTHAPQTMRMSTQPVRPPPKNPMSAASKITKVVNEFFLPLADGFVPEYTPLTSTPDDEEILLLERIWDAFPECMNTREKFVAKMGELYDNGRQIQSQVLIATEDEDEGQCRKRHKKEEFADNEKI